MVELKVEAVALDWKGSPLVVLREQGGQRAVYIWVGLAEATAISMSLEGRHPPRPMTHDLLMMVLREASAKVEQVIITDMRQDTYYADLKLTIAGSAATLDCRPSDAIALALRARAPILIEDDLLDRLEEARRQAEFEAEHISGATVVDTGETTIH